MKWCFLENILQYSQKHQKIFFFTSLSSEDKKLKGGSYGQAEGKAFQDWSSKAIKMPQISLSVILIQGRRSPHVHRGASDPDIPLHFAPHVERRSWEASVLRNPTERGVGEKTG